MRKDDLYVKYRAARKAADDVATTYESGNTVAGMAWEREPKRGEPFPRQVQLVGAAWVAYRYECAAREAAELQEAQPWYKHLVEECQRQAELYRGKALITRPAK